MPKDFQFSDLGPVSEVRAKISASLPGVDWSDPTYGIYRSDEFSYSFNVGADAVCASFGVRVCGGSDVVTPLVEMAGRWGWFLFDASAGEWLHQCEDPHAGWTGFQAYRDRVLGDDAS